jgi:ankyrin repeat protein
MDHCQQYTYLNATFNSFFLCHIFWVDIEVANRHGHTCLMIACYKGHFRIAQFLLSLDANVNRKSVKGNTALHDCAESGSLEILKLLIEHGGKMDVDSYGK